MAGTSVAGRAMQVLRAGLRHLVVPALGRQAGPARAERAHAALEELGGAWVKLGQALALRFDLVPEDYGVQFFRLLNQMRPFPPGEVRRTVEEDLGRPVEELFAAFDFVPFAAASIGQVHRARLPDGTAVAVKVQRPAVKDLIRADLRLMRWLAVLVDLLPGTGEPRAGALVRELRSWTEEELDFGREARNAEWLAGNAAGDPLERNPRIYRSHSSARVLTLEYLEGIPVIDMVSAIRRKDGAFLADLAARGHDLRRIASHIVWNALNQIYRQGCFHADPHPANLLVMPGDSIGYVDFGIVGRLDARTTATLRFFAENLFAGRIELAVDEFERFLVPSRRTDLAAARRDLVEVLTSYLDSTRVGPEGRAPERIFEIEMMAVVRRHAMALHPDAVRYLKAVLTAEALVKELDPGFDLKAHENRFFRRLARIEAAETLRPARLAEIAADLGARATRLLDALEGLRATPLRLGAVAGDVRTRVQIVSAAAIALWLGLLALVWVSGGDRTLLAPGTPLRIAALAAVGVVVGLLLFAIRQVRRLPSPGETPPRSRYPSRMG